MFQDIVKYVGFYTHLYRYKAAGQAPPVLFTLTQIAAVSVALQRQHSFSMNGTVFK